MSPAEIELMAAVEGEHWWYRGLRDAIGRTLATPRMRIPAGGRILDAGCGTGATLALLDRLLRPSYAGGFDLSPVAVRLCRAKVLAADVYQSDIRDPEVHVTDLDLVLSCDVASIAGIEESTAGLLRLVGHLRRGGLLVLNLPAYAWLRSRHDVATDTRDRVTAGQVRRLLGRLGLSIELLTYRVFFLFPGIVLARLPSMLRLKRHPAAVDVCSSRTRPIVTRSVSEAGRPILANASGYDDLSKNASSSAACSIDRREDSSGPRQGPWAGSDLRLAPKWINPLVYPLLAVENALLTRGMRFPWGSSVYAVARKP
jgi:SAM-dependent methyltransferase